MQTEASSIQKNSKEGTFHLMVEGAHVFGSFCVETPEITILDENNRRICETPSVSVNIKEQRNNIFMSSIISKILKEEALYLAEHSMKISLTLDVLSSSFFCASISALNHFLSILGSTSVYQAEESENQGFIHQRILKEKLVIYSGSLQK
ncbi:hypothetical protein NEFER03_2157 [Nematocida sp. LUAm3]|nr:hypothetical protein NEFER03_2157 [Nematocida sp. LUAm3]KAI5174628.1 hypothetical protein NEFER02_0749 [Nematocida sp. LUAm2]KAI5177966.1 hypothetical protein NEFER01_1148 [Nematocida sp. LUAm1]